MVQVFKSQEFFQNISKEWFITGHINLNNNFKLDYDIIS